MKSYGVAIQLKPLQRNLHMVLVVEDVVLTSLLVMKWLMTKHFSIVYQRFHTCFSSFFAFLSALLLFCLLGVAGTMN